MSATAAKVVVPALLGSAITGHLLRKLLAKWTSSRYGGLETARAVESLRPDAFVVDPLAHLLAGPQAMAKYKGGGEQTQAQASQSSSSTNGTQPTHLHVQDTAVHHQQNPPLVPQQQQEEQSQAEHTKLASDTPGCHSNTHPHSTAAPDQQQQQRRPVPRIVMRTMFFDDAVLAAVGAPASRSLAAVSAVLHCREQEGLPHCTQVALLGSGMDTRPWRLALPPGISWFELDRHDVLRAKTAELKKHGVKFKPSYSNISSRNGCSSKGSTISSHRQIQGASNATWASCCALQAARWECSAVDLQVSGWSTQLKKAGFDAKQPTVWVAEGLMYYLKPECVAALLQELASISAPGSLLALNFLLESRLKDLHAARAARSSAASQHTDAIGSSNCHKSAAADGTTTAAGAGSKPDTMIDGVRSSSRAGGRSRLTSELKWGCPDDSQKYFADLGWELLVCLPWTEAAATYGWQPQQAAAAVGRPATCEVQLAMLIRM